MIRKAEDSGSLLSFYSEEQKKRMLNFRSASELLPKADASAVVPVDPVKPAPQLEVVDLCEFVGDYAFPGSSGRLCVDKTSCPARIFGNVEFYRICPTRALNLKEKRKST
jgi:hypothetical protein